MLADAIVFTPLLQFVAATMHMSKLEKEELLQKAFKQLDK